MSRGHAQRQKPPTPTQTPGPVYRRRQETRQKPSISFCSRFVKDLHQRGTLHPPLRAPLLLDVDRNPPFEPGSCSTTETTHPYPNPRSGIPASTRNQTETLHLLLFTLLGLLGTRKRKERRVGSSNWLKCAFRPPKKGKRLTILFLVFFWSLADRNWPILKPLKGGNACQFFVGCLPALRRPHLLNFDL